MAANLPHLDCGGCGRERCYDPACEIVAARSSVEECVPLHPAVDVKIDEPMPMNPSIASIIKKGDPRDAIIAQGFQEWND